MIMEFPIGAKRQRLESTETDTKEIYKMLHLMDVVVGVLKCYNPLISIIKTPLFITLL